MVRYFLPLTMAGWIAATAATSSAAPESLAIRHSYLPAAIVSRDAGIIMLRSTDHVYDPDLPRTVAIPAGTPIRCEEAQRGETRLAAACTVKLPDLAGTVLHGWLCQVDGSAGIPYTTAIGGRVVVMLMPEDDLQRLRR